MWLLGFQPVTNAEQKDHCRSFEIIAKTTPSADTKKIIANHLRSLQKLLLDCDASVIFDHRAKIRENPWLIQRSLYPDAYYPVMASAGEGVSK